MKIIGVDIGSSFIKSALMDLDSGCILAQIKSPAIPWISQERVTRFELSAGKIVSLVRNNIEEFVRQVPDVNGIILSVQMHGFILKIENDPDPHYVSWQDIRCLEKIEGTDTLWIEKLKEIFPDEMMCNSGVHIKSSLALSNMYVLVNEQFVSSMKGEFFTLGSYIIHALTGNNICHLTSAAPTGMIDLFTRDWDQTIINRAGFSNLVFPKIVADCSACGEFEILGQKIKVFPDFGDHQIAILGSSPEINDLIINIGTAAQISQLVDSIIPGKYEIRPFFEGLYLNTITNLPGGRNLDVLLNFILDITNNFLHQNISKDQLWEILDQEDVGQSDGLGVDMKFFTEVDGTPATGSIFNISAHNLTAKNLFGAAYENIIRSYEYHGKLLTQNTSSPKRLLFAGGRLVQQADLVKKISALIGIPGNISSSTDSVYGGIYRIAQICLGRSETLNETNDLVY